MTALELTSESPKCHGEQPWHFYTLQDILPGCFPVENLKPLTKFPVFTYLFLQKEITLTINEWNAYNRNRIRVTEIGSQDLNTGTEKSKGVIKCIS